MNDEKLKELKLLNSLIENTRKTLNSFESIRIKLSNKIEFSKEEIQILDMVKKQYSGVIK